MTGGELVGQAVSGGSGLIVIRERDGKELGMGELVIYEHNGRSTILCVCDLEMGSQMADRVKELVSGTMMGSGPDGMPWYEPGLPHFPLATAKQLVTINGGVCGAPKKIVPPFTDVRRITADDLSFMDNRGSGRLYLGRVRSGSDPIPNTGFWMDAVKAVTHHMLIVASTGRGKSNLVKCMLWGLLDTGGVGMLVLDAHGEYSGLDTHPRARTNLTRYSSAKSPKHGDIMLNVSVRSVHPNDLRGVVDLTDAQDQLMDMMYNKHGDGWIAQLRTDVECDDGEETNKVTARTRYVLHRKVMLALGLAKTNGSFSMDSGADTIRDIVRRLDDGHVVVVDTSEMGVREEQTIGNMLAAAILDDRKRAKSNKKLPGLPPVGVVIEEAPRLLSDTGSGNAYSEIAREGRKFKVGVVAVTQLASVIPDDVLANLSTKIIFGNEMLKERRAIIDAAAQDLSADSRNIASLDPGEAIITSVFAPFAVPIKAPLFDDVVKAGAKPPQKIKVF